MRNITKIFTLVLSLILLFAVSCSNDNKTGISNNPPENDTEITDGETGSSGSGTGGSGTGGSGTETGGGTGTGGDSDSGSGSGSGSGEGGGGTETPPTPSESETTEPLEEKDFPPELLGDYAHSTSGHHDIQVYTITEDGIKKTRITATFINDNDSTRKGRIWLILKNGRKQPKAKKLLNLKGKGTYPSPYIITFDYETKTISGKFTLVGEQWSFRGTQR